MSISTVAATAKTTTSVSTYCPQNHLLLAHIDSILQVQNHSAVSLFMVPRGDGAKVHRASAPFVVTTCFSVSRWVRCTAKQVNNSALLASIRRNSSMTSTSYFTCFPKVIWKHLFRSWWLVSRGLFFFLRGCLKLTSHPH